MGLSAVASCLLKLRLCHCLLTSWHPTAVQWRGGSLGQKPASLDGLHPSFPCWPSFFQNIPFYFILKYVSQKDVIVPLWTTVSSSVHQSFRTRVSCFNRNSWYLFLKPKIRSSSYSKIFYFVIILEILTILILSKSSLFLKKCKYAWQD